MHKTLLKFEKNCFLPIRALLILVSIISLTFEFLPEIDAKMIVVPSLIIGLFIINFPTPSYRKINEVSEFSNYRRFLSIPLFIGLIAEAAPEMHAKMIVVPSLILVLIICSMDIKNISK